MPSVAIEHATINDNLLIGRLTNAANKSPTSITCISSKLGPPSNTTKAFLGSKQNYSSVPYPGAGGTLDGYLDFTRDPITLTPAKGANPPTIPVAYHF